MDNRKIEMMVADTESWRALLSCREALVRGGMDVDDYDIILTQGGGYYYAEAYAKEVK